MVDTLARDYEGNFPRKTLDPDAIWNLFLRAQGRAPTQVNADAADAARRDAEEAYYQRQTAHGAPQALDPQIAPQGGGAPSARDVGRGALGLLDMLNPMASLRDAMSHSRAMFVPGLTSDQRIGHAGDMLSGTAGAVADVIPGLFAARLGAKGTTLTEDMLTPLARDSYRVGQDLMPPRAYAAVGKPSTVTLPDGGPFEARPVGSIRDATERYMRERGLLDRVAPPQPFSEDRARLIAAEYEAMRHAPLDPAVRRSYDAMISETLDQYNMLRDAGIDFKFLQPGMDDPYAASPALGYRDMVENGRLWVFPTDFGFGSGAGEAFDPSTNPLLQGVGRIGDKPDAVANDAFRVVHDAYGHFGPGNPFFRHKGEERAWLEHSRMYSPEARGAMTSETRGQNSWLNFGPFAERNRSALGADTVFADQKSGLMAPWTYDPQGMPDPDRERWLRGLLGR